MFEVLTLKNTALSFFKVVILTTITIITLGFFSPVFAEEQQNDDGYKGNLWDTLRFSFQLEDILVVDCFIFLRSVSPTNTTGDGNIAQNNK